MTNSIGLANKMINVGAFISLGAMITVVSIQVFSRFFMESTPHWTEEAARIFFIYSVAFGTGIGIRNGDFITINLIGRHLSPKYDRLLQISIHVITIAFSIILVIGSWHFIKLGMDERSPALQVTMGFVFASIMIIGLAVAFFTLGHVYNLIKGPKNY
jgi:TRAP-type transport system small permease protein